VGITGGGGNNRMFSSFTKIVEVNEYLVKANLRSLIPERTSKAVATGERSTRQISLAMNDTCTEV